jgi:protein TonB
MYFKRKDDVEKRDDYGKVFTVVEKPPTFPGGHQAWKKFLDQNVDGTVAEKEKAPPGNYAVKVQFIVDTSGNISKVQAIEIPKECLRCGQEAVRVIERSGKWSAAVQSCQKVVFQIIQYIYFQVPSQIRRLEYTTYFFVNNLAKISGKYFL